MTLPELSYSEETREGARALMRLYDAKLGADFSPKGKYAVYFYDKDGEPTRSVGGFATLKEAAEAIPFIRAEAVLEDAATIAPSWEAER